MSRPPVEKRLSFTSSATTAVAALFFTFVLFVVASQAAQAQTFEVLHTFMNGSDGARPYAGLTMDQAGNFYGTAAFSDGFGGHGTVFELTRQSSGWNLTTIYSFQDSPDGAYPTSGVTLGPDGTVYGATFYGGNGGCEYNEGCGTLFKLTPSNGGWTESLLHTFGIVDGDGVYPSGSLIRDEIGAIYGTTAGGGAGSGTVYKLTPSEGNWSENVIYSFGDRAGDGGSPTGGVILDSGGILYGTTSYGGSSGWGTVFQLARSELGWEENILYSFQGGRDGATPQGGLIVGGAGDLYGTTSEASSGRLIGGTVFRLTPSGSDWVHTVLHSFPAGQCFCFYEGPVASLTMDAAGNLYGTTYADGAYLQGSVFKLTRTDEGWTYISLHDFTGGSDGRWPMGSLTFDANGNLYGTASGGGDHSHCYYNGCGVIFEIKP